MHLRVNYINEKLSAQGPGNRYTIWVQGCSIHCPGCSNVDTWSTEGGYLKTVDVIAGEITRMFKAKEIDGVTITGGEPLDQYKPVLRLCRAIRPISIFLTSGYTHAQIRQRELDPILESIDILCSGPFVQEQVCTGEYKGSTNQEVIGLTDLGRLQLTWPVVPKEVIISSDGNAIETGFSF